MIFRRAKVTVIYKSGARQTFRCKDFSLTLSVTGGIKEVKWDNPSPRPMWFGVDEVAAIWEHR